MGVHTCTRIETEAGRRMVDAVRCWRGCIDPSRWLGAAFPTYSFIMQSNLSAPLAVTPALHLIILPPHLPTKSDKTEPLIHAGSFL